MQNSALLIIIPLRKLYAAARNIYVANNLKRLIDHFFIYIDFL